MNAWGSFHEESDSFGGELMDEFGDASMWLDAWGGLPWKCIHTENSVRTDRKTALSLLTNMGKLGQPRGYVVRGVIGSGKRDLVESFVPLVRPNSEAIWVTGSRFAQGIDYGAIQFLFADGDIEAAENPLAAYTTIKDYLCNGTTPLLLIEHSSLLDPLTLAVLAQLLGGGVIEMIIIDDELEPFPDDFETMTDSGALGVIHFGLLSLIEARSEIEKITGCRMTTSIAERIWHFSGRNIQSLRAVVADALEAEALIAESGFLILKPGEMPVGNELRRLGSSRVQGLTPAAVMLLTQLAAGATVSKRDSESASRQLLKRGLLEQSDSNKLIIAIPSLAAVFAERGNDVTRSNHQGWNHVCNKIRELIANHHVNSAIAELGRYCLESENGNWDNGLSKTGSLLMMTKLLLSAGRLYDARKILESVHPVLATDTWQTLDQCERHQTLALAAEWYARTNDLDSAKIILAALVCAPGNCAAEVHLFSPCMEETVGSLLTCALVVGDWDSCRALLVSLQSGGPWEDSGLVEYADFIHVLLAVVSGQDDLALDLFGPLEAQCRTFGDEKSLTSIAAIEALLETDSCVVDPLLNTGAVDKDTSNSLLELMGLSAWVRRKNDIKQLKKLSVLTAERGDIWLASHLLAGALKTTLDVDLAHRLLSLQEGFQHDIALAFSKLSQGIINNDSTTITDALGDLAEFGYSWYVKDDDSKLMQLLSAGEKRQAMRRCAYPFNEDAAPATFGSNNSFAYRPDLTRREKFIAMAAAKGLSNLEIAQKSSVSVRTVEGHLYQIYSKLGISKRGDLAELLIASFPSPEQG